MPAPINTGKQQPIIFPTLRCRPLRESGIPICRESLACACEIPKARLHEYERPGTPVPRLRAIPPPTDLNSFYGEVNSVPPSDTFLSECQRSPCVGDPTGAEDDLPERGKATAADSAYLNI